VAEFADDDLAEFSHDAEEPTTTGDSEEERRRSDIDLAAPPRARA